MQVGGVITTPGSAFLAGRFRGGGRGNERVSQRQSGQRRQEICSTGRKLEMNGASD